MLAGKIVLLAVIATASAQFNRNNLRNNNQYSQHDSQVNLNQRTPSFLANQRSNLNFGAQSGLSNNADRFNQNNPFDSNLGTNHFGAASSQFSSNRFDQTNRNQISRNNNFNSANQFNRQQTFGRTNQQFSTAEAGASVINSRSDNDGLGQYSYGYETDNGIRREETGTPAGFDSYAVSGSYSYTSPEGVEVVVRYTADENGFQVESPNVPATPPHALEQIAAAKEAKLRGLIDENGNPTGSQRNGGFRSLNSNNFQTSNLQSLVNQNRESRNRNDLFNQQNFNSQSRFGSNAQRTSVLRRPLNNNLGTSRTDSFNSQNQFGQNFNDRDGFSSNSQSSRFTQQQQGFGSNLNNRQFGQVDRFGQQNRRLGQTGQFVTPSFQNQIASRLSVQEGSNFRTSQQSGLLHGSDIPSGATGNVASYRIPS